MNKQLLDIYSDYLISSFSHTTATGLSRATDGLISHDKITRFLSEKDFTSKDIWELVKPTIRKIESNDGILIFDDTIVDKPYTDENEIVSWYFDHSAGGVVKGVNIVNCLYHSQNVNIPVAFEVIRKTESVTDPKTKKVTRKSAKTKNEIMRETLKICVQNQIKFGFVLADAWFGSSENMRFIKEENHKDFVIPLKSNRLVALGAQDKKQGRYQRIDSIEFQEKSPVIAFVGGVPFPLLLLKQVFINEDGSSGALYLASSDTTQDSSSLIDIYKKRWHIEEYHKSIKSNTGLAKSPTQTVRTQINHFFSSIYAFVKLERLKIKSGLNHFAIKSRLYLQALRSSMAELQKMKRACA